VSVQKVLLCPFHEKPRISAVTLESAALENIPKFREIEPKLTKILMRVRCSRVLSLKVKWGYISLQKHESVRSKIFAVSISLESKAIRS